MITKGVDNEITLKAFPNPDPNLLDVSFFLFKKNTIQMSFIKVEILTMYFCCRKAKKPAVLLQKL